MCILQLTAVEDLQFVYVVKGIRTDVCQITKRVENCTASYVKTVLSAAADMILGGHNVKYTFVIRGDFEPNSNIPGTSTRIIAVNIAVSQSNV